MRLTARRRVALALLVSWPFAFVWFGWMALTAYAVLDHASNHYASCGGIGPANVPGYLAGCSGTFHPGIAVTFFVLMGLVAVAVAYLLARWTLAPVRAMADTVERLGPTSLGLRLHQRGPRDEARALADAVDSMLDRVAEGYEAQRRFASNASHELRTPLATQRALIEVSLAGALNADQLDLLARQLLATNARNERLVDGLLTLAETEQGLLGHSPQPLERIVLEAVETLRPAAKERGLALDTELVSVLVEGEYPLLDRLVTNLVQNAIKYNVDGGWVHVRLTSTAVLSVANSGPVVAPEQVAGLFEPFRRLGGERLEHAGGVGLGLTIARSIVSAHHGEIEARARPEGGLEIEVRLRRRS